MARTTSDQVEDIICLDSGISLIPFIETANALVTEICAAATKSDGTLWHDDTRLELIERWLSAHFYHIRDSEIQREQAGEVEAVYRSVVEIGFNNTHYGQMALRLDTSGALARLDKLIENGKSVTVSLAWLGKTKTEILAGE